MKKELKTDLEKIAYNCRQATFLIEKRQGEPLTAREKMELKIHLAGCYICRLYEQQSLLINDMVHRLFKSAGGTSDVKLDEQYKEQLKQQISKRISKS
jgi:hypothetical protein